MAYIQDTYYLGDYIATEIKFIGRNGAKGERPEPKRKKYAHWTMARFFKDGIKPDKGYYVMPNTVKVGVNKCTGYSYLYYMQRTISDGKSPGNRIKPQWEADYTHYENS